MLDIDRVVLQEASRQQELLEMVVHPSLGQPTDEVRVVAQAASRAAGLSVSSPLQEYIDRTCSTVYPLLSIRGRKAKFLEHFD